MRKIDPTLQGLTKQTSLNWGTGCFEWTRALDSSGYPIMHHEGKTVLVHRLVFSLRYGKPMDGLVVMHKCDNPKCIRPDHLVAGTQIQNIQDRCRKGRNGACRGEASPSAKLDEQSVRTIRAEFARGTARSAILDQFGISKSQLYRIVKNQSWRHI